MKILVTGSSGMLAHDLIPILKEKYSVVWYDRDILDICDIKTIKSVFEKEKIDIVINCAAYTDVEKAEDEWMLLNYQVNALWPYNIGKTCAELGVDCIHISTDYVFDGSKKEWYLPHDKPNPINQYGMAKYLWEELLEQECNNAIIVRTSWLYGWWKNYKNFVNTMIKLSEYRKELKIVGDQFGAPTYTKDLSKWILEIVENIDNSRSKIFHLSNKTKKWWISWFDFANEIFRILWKDIVVKKCNSEEFPTKAMRPKFSKLVNDSSVVLGDWKKGLKEYIKYF